MFRNRLFSTTVYFMAPPEGDGAGADGGTAGGTGAAVAGDGGAAGAVAAAAPGDGAASSDGAAAAGTSTAATESATHESSPSLLSSAAGKTPGQPAPAAEPKTDAQAADPAVKDGASAEKKPETGKPEEPGKAEVKADAATDPATKDATPAAAPAPVSVEDLKLPEGMVLKAEEGKALVDIFNNAELSGKDRLQGLFDLHVKEVERVHKELVGHQQKVWSDLNVGWKKQLREDPELGGNRLDTCLSRAKAVVEEFLSADDAKAFLVHTDLNGMGNFPPFVRLLNALGKKLNIFEDSIVTGGKAPTPPKGPGQRGWYNNSPNMTTSR